MSNGRKEKELHRLARRYLVLRTLENGRYLPRERLAIDDAPALSTDKGDFAALYRGRGRTAEVYPGQDGQGSDA